MAERKRRHRDEGTIFRMCSPKDGCPPVETTIGPDGKSIRQRPEHQCTARWAYSLDLGFVAGRRSRPTVTARTKRELDAKAKALREKIALGVTPTAKTVGEWLDYWIERVAPESIRGTTLRSYRSKIDTYLTPALGHIRLQDLRPEHVEQLHDWMRTLDKSRTRGRGSGRLSDATIRQAHMVLRSALGEALARGLVLRNAAAVVRAPKASGDPHPHLTSDQAKAVLKSAPDERTLCRLACALILGLRQGEALALRWEDYRPTPDGGRILTVQEAVQRLDGGLTRTDVKSSASHRTLPVPERLQPILDAWQAVAAREHPGERYIFPGHSGGPEDSKRDWIVWRDALAAAGIPHVPLHGARGSAASLLADMGEPDWRIAEILGHGQVIVTRRHYISGTPESHQVAIAGLVDALLP